MMTTCELCGRKLDTEKELDVHQRYFHGIKGQGKDICPDCGSQVFMQEGCRTCRSCGWSKCA